jgi:hypothetical protein
MNVNVKITGVSALQASLGNTARRVGIAQSRAIRDTLSWTRTRVRRDAAKQLKVPQRALQSRLLTSTVRNGDTTGKLWAGTWMISPFAVGKPRQGKSGGVVGVPGRRYVGSFLFNVYGGLHNIWIRLRSKHYTKELYPGSGRRSSGSVPEHLRHRFPVVKAAIEVEPTMAGVFDRDEVEIRHHFDKRLKHHVTRALDSGGRP